MSGAAPAAAPHIDGSLVLSLQLIGEKQWAIDLARRPAAWNLAIGTHGLLPGPVEFGPCLWATLGPGDVLASSGGLPTPGGLGGFWSISLRDLYGLHCHKAGLG